MGTATWVSSSKSEDTHTLAQSILIDQNPPPQHSLGDVLWFPLTVALLPSPYAGHVGAGWGRGSALLCARLCQPTAGEPRRSPGGLPAGGDS